MASDEQKQAPRRRGIKVIGAGLGRTGTKSLAAALDILGYKTYHFPLPQHSATWAAYASGTGSVQDAINTAVVDGYDATCDQPMADVFQDQMGMFSEARVILTVRDSPEKWAASWKVLVWSLFGFKSDPFLSGDHIFIRRLFSGFSS